MFWHQKQLENLLVLASGRKKDRKRQRSIMWKKRGKKLAQKRKKIGIAAAAVIVAAAGSTLIYHNLPQTKVEKQLTLAAKYMTEDVYKRQVSSTVNR